LADTPVRKDYLTAAHNILIYKELGRALQSLGDAGVPVILLKGAALAKTIYPSIADRPMGDVDLLVYPADRDRARAALEAVGYRFVPERRQRFSPFDTEFTGEMAFRHGEQFPMDLHWELTPNEWIRRLAALDIEAVWQEAVPLQLNQQQALQLSPCDTLLHLCLHLTAHGYVHPHGLHDIQRLTKYYHPFPWVQFTARARQFRMGSLCYFVLEAMAAAGNIAVPHEVLDVLRPPTWQCWLVRQIADPREALTGKLGFSKSRGYLLYLAVADRFIDIARAIAWLLLPGPRWLAERYRLKGRFRPWLACFWHPVIVLWHGTCGLWTVARSRVWRADSVPREDDRTLGRAAGRRE